ncbi:hypothetical protein BDR07DRAFT_1372713 [Suillus spraguei]|nr:hypothetical protein BDR07DRAFT_1372713 [Suillus spraguei]
MFKPREVWWSSTYIMLNHAEMNKEHVDTFIYEMGCQEHNLSRCAKIDFLQLSEVEWTYVGQFANLLSAWSLCAERSKYMQFAFTLKDAAAKVDEYYEKTTHSAALLHPTGKMVYFKKYWPEDLHKDVLSTAETVHTTKQSRAGGLKNLICEVLSDSEDDSSTNPVPTSIGDPTRPWRAEFLAYLKMVEVALPSFLSERVFLQGGITITKQCNWLKADIIEALQCVKCALQCNLLFQEPEPSSLIELEHLDDNDSEVEAEVEAETGDAVDDEEGWDILLLGDDAEDVLDIKMDI